MASPTPGSAQASSPSGPVPLSFPLGGRTVPPAHEIGARAALWLADGEVYACFLSVDLQSPLRLTDAPDPQVPTVPSEAYARSCLASLSSSAKSAVVTDLLLSNPFVYRGLSGLELSFP